MFFSVFSLFIASERLILLIKMSLGVFVEPGANVSESLVFFPASLLPVYPDLVPLSPRTSSTLSQVSPLGETNALARLERGRETVA